MTPDQLTERFATIQIEIDNAVRKTIPMKVANRAATLYKENFQTESFFGQKWVNVRRRTGKKHRYTTKSDKTRIRNIPPKKDAFGRRPILTGQMGDIGGSLEIQTGNGETIVKFNFVYSAIHNDGGRARCRI